MNRKKVSLILLLVVISLFSVQFVAAQGIFDSPGMKSLKDAFSAEFTWPPFGVDDADKTPIALGIVILAWIGLFAVLYVVAGTIPPFKDSQNKMAIMWFTFAIAGIAVTGTNFVPAIMGLVDFTSTIFQIFLFIAVILLVITLLQQFTQGRFTELHKGRVEGEQQRHAADKASREALLERQAWDKEDQAAQQATNLIRTGIAGLGTIEQQIQELINIITQITQIRDEGRASLKAQFHRQAAAVASNITRNTKLDAQISKMLGLIKQLEHNQVNIIEKLRADESALAAGDPRKAAIQNWFNNNNARIKRFEAAQRQLLAEMQPLVTGDTDLRKFSEDIEDMMNAVIRDVNNNQYPEAVANLNHALNNARREQAVLAQVSQLVSRTESELKKIQSTITAAP